MSGASIPRGGAAVMQQRREPPVISRKDAREKGKRWYFSGVPCKRGHVAKRSVVNSDCRRCHAEKRAGNERVKERERLRNRSDVRRQQARQSYAKHAEKRRAYDRQRYEANSIRREKASALVWWKLNDLNRGKFNYRVARRRAWVKRATPAWLTADQRAEIRSLYVEAAQREGDWHVDHVVPLRGRAVCGLNVPWNLQIITAEENWRKRNDHAS